jgi:hypothetical protein
MRATASQNVRVSQPVYHVALSFDPTDNVDRATMERVADNILRELKLNEHQAIIVAHEDRAHPHLHILVNRIHPETGRAWDRWQDYPVIQRVLRDEERALNLRGVQASVDMSRDKGRADEAVLQPRQRAQGDDESRPSTRRRVSTIDAEFDALDRARKSADERFAGERELAAAESRRGRVEAALAREAQAHAAFGSSLEKAYVDPRAAANAFLRTAEQDGERAAAAKMRESPELFGRLIGSERDSFLRGATRRVEAARETAREAAGHGASLVAARREVRSLVAGHERSQPSVWHAPLETDAVKEMVQAQVETVRSRLAAFRDAEKRVPNREQVELRLSQMLRHLAPQEFEALRAQLSPERFSIAHKLRRMVRDAALGRDVEE